MQTYAYGFPRLGKDREYKKAIEAFWNNEISEAELRKCICNLEKVRLSTYEKYVDNHPLGEMTLYDNILDTALMLNTYSAKNLGEYFDLCRGKNALAMCKWFNTNYHYLVPEFNDSFSPDTFKIAWNKPEEEANKHQKGIPYLVGPFTFLKLSRGIPPEKFGDYLLSLADVYLGLIGNFEEIHIDEPAFVMELKLKEVELIKKVYEKLGRKNKSINVFTYYSSVDFLKELYDLPIKGIGLDFINGRKNFNHIKDSGFPEDKVLIAGVVNGRNIWKTEIKEAVTLLEEISPYVKNTIISNAAPLYHLPVTVKTEPFNKNLKNKFSFAEERLEELKIIARVFEEKNGADYEPIKACGQFGINPEVQKRVEKLTEKDFIKPCLFEKRRMLQQQILNLPLFPTTTIGSFPQTPEIRKKRADFKAGRISKEKYKCFIEEKIRELIGIQENIGLDVFVHGEFERTDMVEFFAQKLEGIATSKNGWIISYGTRTYRPPIIFGDVSRPEPMTISEISYAQNLTDKPVKGMLTGPVTIISWSFVREDIPVEEVAFQIALCLQDEIKDYEKNGIKIVQIDEPAIRERAPIKKRNWGKYFNWAIKSFNLASQSKPETQIHTHMCYSEFGEIIDKINQMEFDIITIETSKGRSDIIKYFERVDFKKQIGLGVWDIHSPLVPDIQTMKEIVERALKYLPEGNFWINPDCGLKTRGWKETKAALSNLVKLAKTLRQERQSNAKG